MIAAALKRLDSNRNIEVATRGDDGLARYTQHMHDVVVSDNVHPGIMGTELIGLILARNPSQRVILQMSTTPYGGCEVTMPTPTDADPYLRNRVDTILSPASRDALRAATEELFRYLCENPQPAEATARGKCFIAMDFGAEPLLDIFTRFLPTEWREHFATVSFFDGFASVIRMVRDTLPALLVIQSNLLNYDGVDLIATCVAVSPGTRYLLLTSWPPEAIQQLHKHYAPLWISMGILNIPCTAEEFIAALSVAAGDAFPKLKDRH